MSMWQPPDDVEIEERATAQQGRTNARPPDRTRPSRGPDRGPRRYSAHSTDSLGSVR